MLIELWTVEPLFCWQRTADLGYTQFNSIFFLKENPFVLKDRTYTDAIVLYLPKLIRQPLNFRMYLIERTKILLIEDLQTSNWKILPVSDS